MNDMKLIMESWRSYAVEQNSSLEILKENADKGLITEERLAELWLQSLDDDWNQMINEGIIDALKKGAAAVKKGGKFIADKIMAAYNAAADKINEWITRLYIGGLDILSRTIKKVTSFGPVRKFISGMSALVEKIKDFKYNHPVLFKIVQVTAVVATVAAILYLMAGEANAKIEHPDNPEKIMSGAEDTWQGAKGICTVVLKNSDDPEVQDMAKECIQIINDYGPGGVDSGDVLAFGFPDDPMVNDIIRDAGGVFNDISAATEEAKAAKAVIGSQWVDAGSPESGPLYDQFKQAVREVNDYNDYIQDLLKAGKEGTYATQELTTTMLKGGGFKQSITVAGDVSKINPGTLPTGLEFAPGG